MKLFSIFLLVFFSFSLSVFAQDTLPNDDILKISTTLIQADVTVTDKKGNIITDLKPEEFEIYENGKKQDITNFSFISVEKTSASAETNTSNSNSTKVGIPIPPIKLKAEQVRRTYALVVDDLGLNFGNIFWVRQSLVKFVNEQMQQGDLVAIIRTGGGIGALQSFTSDKRQLLATISKIKWNSQGRSGINTFTPIEKDLKDEIAARSKSNRQVEGGDTDKEFQKQLDEFRTDNFSAGTLGALNYVIRGMKELPGRKAVLLFSEGFVLTTDNRPNRILDSMRVLADLANRSSVVIYTLDPRGLQVPGMGNVDDDISDIFDASQTSQLTNREDNFRDSQQSLRYLAEETGGIPFVNQNNIDFGIRLAIADQSSYYLLGYQPDTETFDPKKAKFNKLEIKVTRPGLKIRYRSGFFGITDEKIQKAEQTPRQKLIEALTSPFSKNDINLSVYPVYQNDAKAGNLVQALVHIDAKDLTFTETNGKRKANIDLVATTFGDNGTQLDSLSKNYTMEVGEKVYQNMLINGFVYTLAVPIKKSGAYQFRVAMRDAISNKVGSASQFIEVPNFDKKITLSNIVLDNFTPEEWQKVKSGSIPEESQRSVLLDTTLRQYKRGTLLRYDYFIYNPKRSQQITNQVRLIRDGKVIYEEDFSPIQTAEQSDLVRLSSFGAISLGKNLETGNYILQTIAIDKTAKEKSQMATQFVEFEIID